jgi:hypothetical protein
MTINMKKVAKLKIRKNNNTDINMTILLLYKRRGEINGYGLLEFGSINRVQS